MTRLRILAALVLWMTVGLAADAARVRRVAAWIDLPETLARGPHACRAALSWGWRCRWERGAWTELQHAADGCGPAALEAVLRRGEPAPTQDLLWSMCRRPGGGTTLGTLSRAARCFGRRPRLAWDPCLERVAAPAIVHLKRGHFVVLERRGTGCASVLDPACGHVRIPWSVLRTAASGAALEFPASPPRVPLGCCAHREDAS